MTLIVLALAALAAGPPADRIDPPAAAGALAPNLTITAETVYLTWLEPTALRFSSFREGVWTGAKTIVRDVAFFANWADLPSLAAAADGTLVAHWLQKSGPDTYAYDVMVARSTDGGTTWKPLGPAHDDKTKTEHGFVSLIAEDQGIRAFWLDGRELAAVEGSAEEAGSHPGGSMALRTALIAETVAPGGVLDPRVCECCNTAAVMTDAGPVVVYRDRSAEEVRDISIIRRVGGRWTPPRVLAVDDWLIAGCPVNGPAMAARGSHLVVAWFTAPAGRAAVRAAISLDAGATFADPLTLDDSWPVGRVDVVLTPSGDAIVSWLDATEAGGAIVLRRISQQGRMGAPVKVAQTRLSRASGFPRLALSGAHLLVVWTDEGHRKIRAATMPLAGIPDARSVDPARGR